MFIHSHTRMPSRGVSVRTVGKGVWLFITTFFSILRRVTRGLLKFIFISTLFMTEMW